MRLKSNSDIHPNALAVSVVEAARLIGIGRATIYKLLAGRQLPSITVGRRRLVRVADIEAFLARRAAASSEAA